MRPYYQNKERIYTEEEKGVSIVKRREGGGIQVHNRTIEKRVH